MKTDKPTFSENHGNEEPVFGSNLYGVYRVAGNDSEENFWQRYTLLKLGDPGQRRSFLKELVNLAAMVHGEQIKEDSARWAVTTAATNYLAQEFSQMLSCQLGLRRALEVFDASMPANPGTDYSHLSAGERITTAQSFYRYHMPLNDRKVLLIDDLHNTGTALRALAKELVRNGACQDDLFAFVFAIANFETTSDERKIVEGRIMAMPPERIIRILSHPDYYVTSAAMFRVLASLPSPVVRRLVENVSDQRRTLLAAHAIDYYHNQALPHPIAELTMDIA